MDPNDTRTLAWADVGTWTATAISRSLASYAILQGTVVLAYGPDRWQTSPALQTALQVPGQTATWGVALAVAGLVGLYGSLRKKMHLTAAGHFAAGLWSMFFAISMARYLLPGTAAPTTGFFVYGAESVVFLTLAYGAWRLR